MDYPESRPALRDLAACLTRARLHGALTARFRAAIQTRLLHAGAAPPAGVSDSCDFVGAQPHAATWL